MEGDSEQTYHVDRTDTEYISGLSTLLAATIQETKESVSQIEYLFDKQLFSDFQSTLKKVYSEAKKAAEGEWKKKETDLMVRAQTLESEKQKVLEENQFLKIENSKMKKVPSDLEKRKVKEMAEKRELQKSLRELLDSKGNMINGNEKRLKELEEENKVIKLNIESKCRIVEEKEESNCELLQLVRSKIALIKQKERELKQKDNKLNELSAKLEEKKEFRETLVKKTRTQAAEILKTKQLLDDCETENRVLTDQIHVLEESCKRQQQLIEQNGSKRLELMRIRHEYEDVQKDKTLLVMKVRGLEEEVEKLQAEVKERGNESTEGMELHGILLQQIEGKNGEIMMEKQKRKQLIYAYKKLKSQYNCLCTKAGLASENMNNSISIHDQSNSHKNANSLSGTKRPVSHWRDTRPTNRNGPDPHDDFLDTPLENIKQDVKREANEDVIHHLPRAAPKDMNSDDETQDLNPDHPGPQRLEKETFKNVEPIRKKAERANFKGVECKQCRKFYDLVLPGDGSDSKHQSLQCVKEKLISQIQESRRLNQNMFLINNSCKTNYN